MTLIFNFKVAEDVLENDHECDCEGDDEVGDECGDEQRTDIIQQLKLYLIKLISFRC